MRSEFLKRHLSNFSIRAPRFIFAGLVFLLLPFAVLAASAGQHINVSVSSSIPYNHCADGVKNFDETGVDCGGALCSSCGGGGGGGGGVISTQISFSGLAAPNATVKVLKDGVLAGSVLANTFGNFSLNISGLSGGNYRFTLYFDDVQGQRSSLYNSTLTVSQGQSILVQNILLSPSITIDKEQIQRGDWLSISGQSVPNSQIIISITPASGAPETLLNATTDINGNYILKYIAADIPFGDYKIKAKVKVGNLQSDYSPTQNFTVGTKTVEIKPGGACPLKGDVNGDCRVNLIDFSITAFWYKRQIDAEFTILEADQLSNDGFINLVDFSILAYYWTG